VSPASRLVGVMLGVVFAKRREPKHERQAGSLSELTLPHALRAQIKQLSEDTRRLRAERDELLGVLTRLAQLLELRSAGPTRRPQ
jgi:hypothetical protein